MPLSPHSPDHIPVFAAQLVPALALRPGQIAVDATAGRGGHTAQLLEAVGPDGHVVALDRDPDAVVALQQRFAKPIERGQLSLIHTPFAAVHQECAQRLPIAPHAIIADLGVSSPQLDVAARGFSFRLQGPLDMRMDHHGSGPTAADLIAEASVQELADIFRTYGEEPRAWAFAKAIDKARLQSPITETLHLATIIASHSPARGRIHPATRVFQALRMVVNDELGQLSTFLEESFALLAPAGQMAIITFHSLEDRLVKQFFRFKAGAPPPRTSYGAEPGPAVATLGRPFPQKPCPEEIASNPRARSAKLRRLYKHSPSGM